MEGLEISVINSNDFKIDNFDYRLDSEYFNSSNLFLLKQLEKVGFKKIGDFCYVTDGIHTSIDYCVKSKVNLISATSPRENYFDVSRQVFISEEAHKHNPRTALVKDDIVISTVGTIGNCAVVTDSILPANTDRHVGIIRIKDDFMPNYVSTFLLTKYGRFQSFRESTGNVQLNLFLYKIRTLKIANLSIGFQLKIDSLISMAHNKISQTQTLYKEAEALLLETLRLNNFEPTVEAVNVKSFKDSFLNSGRLDAEYYQKKYENYLDLIFNYSNGWEKIEKACTQKDINFTPNDSTEYKYIELASIGKTGDVKDCTIALGGELPTRARRKVNTNDVIISSIEGSLDSCAIITDEYDNALCSTGFYVLTSKKINSETLLVLFKSEPIQQILKKGCSGTILTAISKSEFQNIPIPIIEIPIQEKIASLVSESFTLKKQSEQLLETAKRAVEIAIEENEDAAIHFINVAIN